MCPASLLRPAQGSQRRINDGVDVTSQHVGFNARQPFPALNEFDRSGTAAWQRAQLGDRAPVPSDDHTFAALHTVQHLSPSITQVAHGH
jgi:hypothetical protein